MLDLTKLTLETFQDPETRLRVMGELTAFVEMPEDDAMEMPEELLQHFTDLNAKVGKFFTILDARRFVSGYKSATLTERVNLDTLELLHEVARHLCGKAVNVSIRQTRDPEAVGEAYAIGDTGYITIHPRVVWDGDTYLETFLHEVAHIKLHKLAPVVKAATSDQRETEAQGLAYRWLRYADDRHGLYFYDGAKSQAAQVMRAKLFALLDSPDAPNWTYERGY